MHRFLFGTPYEHGIFGRVRIEIGYLLCKLRGGHKWDAEAAMAPDTATEYFWCVRCGDSWDVTYY